MPPLHSSLTTPFVSSRATMRARLAFIVIAFVVVVTSVGLAMTSLANDRAEVAVRATRARADGAALLFAQSRMTSNALDESARDDVNASTLTLKPHAKCAFVGDSSAREAYGAFANVARVDESAVVDIRSSEKHRNWAHDLRDGGRATFTWAPYASDAIEALANAFAGDGERAPDVVVLSCSLWHALNDDGGVATYARAMATLGERLRGIQERYPRTTFAWLNAPTIRRELLSAANKIERFTEDNLRAYDDVQRDQDVVGVIQPRGPCVLIDVRAITAAAPVERCVDGVHYDGVVYDAVARIVVDVARSRWR